MLERILGQINGPGRAFAQLANDAILADIVRDFHALLGCVGRLSAPVESRIRRANGKIEEYLEFEIR